MSKILLWQWKVFLKHTPAGQLSNTEVCMCTGAHCCPFCQAELDADEVPNYGDMDAMEYIFISGLFT